MAFAQLKVTDQVFNALKERIIEDEEYGAKQTYPPHQLLGKADDMGNEGECRRCLTSIDEGYLVPGYGYVCERCGLLLLVRGLVNKIDDAMALASQAAVTLQCERQRLEDLKKPLPVSEEFIQPADGSALLLSDDSLDYYRLQFAVGLGISPEAMGLKGMPPVTDTPTQPVEPVVEAIAEAPKEPSPAAIPFCRMPPGTVLRTPLKTHGRFAFLDEDADVMPGCGIYEIQVGARELLGDRTTIRKASSHVSESPAFDPSSFSESELAVYEGYRPGTVRISNLSDVQRYEQTVGDPELMRLLAEEDDAELKEAEEVHAAARRARGSAAPLARTANGVRMVQTFDPVMRERRRNGLQPRTSPLQPIDDNA